MAVNIKISVNPLNGALSGASRKPAVNVGGTYGVVVLTTRSNRITAAMGRRENILNYNLSSRDLNRVKFEVVYVRLPGVCCELKFQVFAREFLPGRIRRSVADHRAG